MIFNRKFLSIINIKRGVIFFMNDNEFERWKPIIFLVLLPVVYIVPYEIMKYCELPSLVMILGTILFVLIYGYFL